MIHAVIWFIVASCFGWAAVLFISEFLPADTFGDRP